MPHACAHTSKQTVGKAKLRSIDRERTAVQNCVAGLQTAAAAWFRKLRLSLTAQLQAALAESAKASDDTKRKVQKILDDLNFDGYEAFIEIARAEMGMLYGDSAKEAAAQLQQRLGVDAFELVNERGVAYARDRSAEMVGMKWVDGELVQNPNARWRIDDGTRELLRSDVTSALENGWSNDELANALAESYAFSERRAEVIARTETADADVEGTLAGYRALGVTKKRWLTAPDCCDDCQTLDGEEVGIDEDFTAPDGSRISGPTLHPQCRCDVLPVLDDDDPPAKGLNLKDNDMIKSQLIWNGAARDAFRLAFPIEKTEKLEDGRLAVYGVATSEALDCDGEVIDYDAAKAAFSAWPGNIREQHDPKKAVGRALEVTADDDAKQIRVKAVISAGAPDTQAKILDGTLQCFSIGGKVSKRAPEPVTKADGSVVTAQRVFVKSITETSVVDVGANPDSGIAIVKAVGDDLVWAEAGPEEEGSEGGEHDVTKGLYTAQRLIEALGCVRDCVGSAEYEQRYGEHSEAIVAEMKSTLAAIGAIAQKYLGEEIALMLAPKEAAAGTGDLAKAGKRFSTKTKAALKAAHEACKAADKALADLGYDADEAAEEEGEEGGEKAATADDLRKAVGCPDDQEPAAWVEKMRSELQALRDVTPTPEFVAELAKAAGFELAEPTLHDLTKAAITELVALRKAHADLKASPAAPKGVLRAMVVDKAADRGEETKEPEPVVKADGTVDDAATLMKAAQARPIRITA
jgi:phage head maturation protease